MQNEVVYKPGDDWPVIQRVACIQPHSAPDHLSIRLRGILTDGHEKSATT